MITEIIDKNRESFLRFNKKKVQRFEALLPSVQIKIVLQAALFFLHTNQSRLPGYVGEATPSGISNFSIDDDTKAYLKKKFKTIDLNQKTDKPFVEMAALIGSAGTIAYNRKSDFDFWICVDQDAVSEKKYALFRQKVRAVQEWAEHEIHLEVHLFVNDITSLKRNLFDEDDDEAFGSTLGALLKDEFFRSSIILAGKIPFWWVVPLETDDASYDSLYEALPDSDKKDFYIDIGNLYNIKKEDFIGAALFQIVKSLGNPFKSILKLGVLEKYLFESAEVTLISHKLKQQIHDGKISNITLDSYLFMFAEVFRYYYTTLEDRAALNILKVNLYLKINPLLSKYTSLDRKKNLPYKVSQMYQYTQHWKWPSAFIADLDNFDNWDFTKVTKFWSQVKKFMLISYQKISKQFANFDLKSKISKSDYTLLSRKIRGHFSSEREKVEKYVTFKESTYEPYLHIAEMKTESGESLWRLLKKTNSQSGEETSVLLKQDSCLFTLLAWTAINGLYEKSLSRISMSTEASNIHTETIQLLNLMADSFKGKGLKTKNSYYLKEMFSLVNLVVINYFQRKRDKIYTVDHLYYTSWGEPFHYGYKDSADLSDILFHITKDGFNLKKSFDEFCMLYGSSEERNTVNTIRKTFKEAYNHLVLSKQRNVRFITKLFTQYVSISREGEHFSYSADNALHGLIAEVSENSISDVVTAVYSNGDPFLDRMKFVLDNANTEKISLFYEIQGAVLFLFVVNENKNLFVALKPASQKDLVLTHYLQFCKNSIEALREVNPFTHLDEDSIVLNQLVASTHPPLVVKPSNFAASQKNFSTSPISVTVHPNKSYMFSAGSQVISSTGLLEKATSELISYVKSKPELLRSQGSYIIDSIRLKGWKQNAGFSSNVILQEKFKADRVLNQQLKPT